MNGSDELPISMGKVAPRELKAAGIANLSEASRYSEQQLLAIHGVGPKAIRELKAALAAKQLKLRQD